MPKYEIQNFVVIFLVRVLSTPKKFLHTVRNKILKNHDNCLKNNKVIQSQKNSKFLA